MKKKHLIDWLSYRQKSKPPPGKKINFKRSWKILKTPHRKKLKDLPQVKNKFSKGFPTDSAQKYKFI